MSDALFLCFGDRSECQNCGGWIHADGCVPEGMPGHTMENGSGVFCSLECADEAQRFCERLQP